MAYPYRYTSEYYDVETHGKQRLHVMCTSEVDKADKVLSKLMMMLGGGIREERIIGVDVEFRPDVDVKDTPSMYQTAAVLQLCIDNEVLVYHISAAAARPPRLQNFLNIEHYTYAGFSIGKDREMLELVGLVIRPDRFIDIQQEWRKPNNRVKPLNSLADVASIVIDLFYRNMKGKINNADDHKKWVTPPLTAELVHYAALDAYTTYETWRHISIMKRGMKRSEDDMTLQAEGYALWEIYGRCGVLQYD